MSSTIARILPLMAILTLLLACEPDPWETRETERKIDRINSIATVNAKATAKVKTINPQPTVVTTLADLTVWRLCATDWSNEQQVRPRLDAVYALDTSELSKHRTYSLRVASLVKDMIDSWPNVKASGIGELHDACAALQRADWERR